MRRASRIHAGDSLGALRVIGEPLQKVSNRHPSNPPPPPPTSIKFPVEGRFKDGVLLFQQGSHAGTYTASVMYSSGALSQIARKPSPSEDPMQSSPLETKKWWEAVGWNTVAAVINALGCRGINVTSVTTQCFMNGAATPYSEWIENGTQTLCKQLGFGMQRHLFSSQFGEGDLLVVSATGEVHPSLLRSVEQAKKDSVLVSLGMPGIHPDQVNRARLTRILERLANGYDTFASADGTRFGDLFLERAPLYGKTIIDCQQHRPESYLYGAVMLGSGGWNSLLQCGMRVVITDPPKPSLLFQGLGNIHEWPPQRLYGCYGMGTGAVLFVKKPFASTVCSIAQRNGLEASIIGHVEEADTPSVFIPSLKVELITE